MNISNNYGWICPKCGKVMSPNESECLYCNKDVGYCNSLYDNNLSSIVDYLDNQGIASNEQDSFTCGDVEIKKVNFCSDPEYCGWVDDGYDDYEYDEDDDYEY